MCSVTEKPASGDIQPQLDKNVSANDFRPSPRRRKEALLPEITRLALEGDCGEAIGRKLGLSKRTVNRWLQGLRQEWIAKTKKDAAAKMAVALARLDGIYREAVHARLFRRFAAGRRKLPRGAAFEPGCVRDIAPIGPIHHYSCSPSFV